MHFLLACVNPFGIYELVTTTQEILGWDEAHTMELIAGLSTKSTEPSRKLAELARMAIEHPTVLELVNRANADAVDRLVQDPVHVTVQSAVAGS